MHIIFMNKNIGEKYLRLKNQISNFGSAIVAFSGGVDSALVLKVAHDVLGDNAVAVTADSGSIPRRELEDAKDTAKKIGARHFIIKTEETSKESYLKNPTNRCYYCKSELYLKLKKISQELGIKKILNGTNLDDMGDHRPGIKAAEEYSIISPLKDAAISKKEVREIAMQLRLNVWDKPSSPCLSSRVPYGEQITLKKLKMIEEAEDFLKDLGIKEIRVRHFGKVARIESNETGKKIINENFASIEGRFFEIGFNEITLSDFKSGSLNIMVGNG